MTKQHTIKIRIECYPKETPELRDEFERLGLQAFDSLYFQFHNIKPGIYHVETKHIFSNQYNTVEGFRVFEKCTCLTSLGNPLRGYYIAEGIDEIRAYQKRVKRCHYCSAQYIDSNLEWCTECRGSEYLKPDNYHLLKLTNLMDEYAPSDIAIPPDVMEDIERQQRTTKTAIIERNIERRLQNIDNSIRAAKKEKKFLLRCVELGLPIDNVIYYGHTDTFCFGWRDPIGETGKNHMLKKLQDDGVTEEYNITFK